MDWNLILIGAGTGLVTGISGWWKNASADGKVERMELMMLVPTMVSGALCGLAAHLPMPEAWKAGVLGLGPVVLTNLVKGLWRHKGGIGGALADLRNPEAPKA